MKTIILMMAFVSLSVFSAEQVSNTGNGNVTNICQPKVIVKTCSKCNTCKKTKVIHKTKYKTKWRTRTKTVKKEVIKKVPTYKKNRLRLLGGYGPDGVSAEKHGSEAIAYEDKGAVFGVGYDRMLNDRWSVGGQIQTNETFLLSVGFDF